MRIKTIFAVLMTAVVWLLAVQSGWALTNVSAVQTLANLEADASAVMFDVRTVDEHNGYCPPWATIGGSACVAGNLRVDNSSPAGTPEWRVTATSIRKLPINIPYWNTRSRNTAVPNPPENEAQVRAIIGKLLEAGTIDYSTPIYLLCRTAFRSYWMGRWMDSTRFAPGTGLDDGNSNHQFQLLYSIDGNPSVTNGNASNGQGGMQEWKSNVPTDTAIYTGITPPHVFSITPVDGDTEAVSNDLNFRIGIVESTPDLFTYPVVDQVSLYIDGTERDFSATGTSTYGVTEFPFTVNLANGDYNWISSAQNSAGTSWATPHALDEGSGRSLTVAVVPDITVTDSVIPADDLGIPFGEVIVGGFRDETLSIQNDGYDVLTISSISINSPFSVANTTGACSTSSFTLAAGASCQLTIRFEPADPTGYSGNMTISSNDSDESTVQVAVSGTGTTGLAANITIIDTVLPATDYAVPFGEVLVGESSPTETVTVRNSGTATLDITGIDISSFPAQFSVTDSCPASLAPTESCDITIQFNPDTRNDYSPSIIITSNDPSKPSVTVAISGSGIEILVTVTDPVAPYDDLLIPFGGVVFGDASEQTVSVTNDGNADITIANIGETLVGLFSIVTDMDDCSGQTLKPAASCTFTIRFEPSSAGGNSAADINIPTAASQAVLRVTGIGLTQMNNPPYPVDLISPNNGQAGLGTTLEFRWRKAIDPDGDTVSYDLYWCENQDFSGCSNTEVAITSLQTIKAIDYARFGSGGGLLLVGMVFTGGFMRRRRIQPWLVMALVATTLLVSACGGGNNSGNSGGGGSDEVSYSVSGLSSGTTYYYKVIAKDDKGGTTESETRSFTTQ